MKEKEVYLTIRVKEDLRRKIKMTAFKNGMSIKKFIHSLLDKVILE